jgi:prepilin-type N-terminal cleavage/methylation domain-containing protein
MKTALHRHRLGFTLVEIMIVVTIISLLAGPVPAFMRSRKRAQATRTLEELRMLEYALDRWAIEQNKSVGDAASFSDLRPFLKSGSPLAEGGVDVLGNTYGDAFSVDYIPKVNSTTFDSLSDVAPAEFWSPYKWLATEPQQFSSEKRGLRIPLFSFLASFLCFICTLFPSDALLPIHASPLRQRVCVRGRLRL